ncbi:MAG: sigma 54-interacting transcriptional regulator [Candidatus Zixiibacteriota bacterium]
MNSDQTIIKIMEGTSSKVGIDFFRSLVKNLAEALDVHGAWVTEYLRDCRRLRALALWLDDNFVEHYEYDISGTPCEPVVEKKCLVHYSENVVELYPHDPDLKSMNAVSYMGVPLTDPDGAVMGHLAILDNKPMPQRPSAEAVFRIFAARAGAELCRIRAERSIVEREEKIALLIDSAMDAIIELNKDLIINRVNRSAVKILGAGAEALCGRQIADWMPKESGSKLSRLTVELRQNKSGRPYLWIPGGLILQNLKGESVPVEASLSHFKVKGESYFSIILRDIREQLIAERKIDTLAHEAEYLKEELEKIQKQGPVLYRSEKMHQVMTAVAQVAPTDSTALICGETGTGKELIARIIHEASKRSASPMIRVNCAAIPSSLIESEFFGHEKGAFTGAINKREGRFQLADRGTIFLDEVGELPLDTQAKLLRVLQEGEFEPVGGSRTVKVDVRVIAATNRDLKKDVAQGKFREDLYYRLDVFPITVPPLRERGEDIILLAEFFLEKYARELGRTMAPLTPECYRYLMDYNWPGNVRELQNVIERAVIMSRNGELRLASLIPVPETLSDSLSNKSESRSDKVVRSVNELKELERKNIIAALERASWKVAGNDGAARILGIPPTTLSSRMKALGITRPHGLR